ncbi:HmuY family protein [Rhabdobacter roseus]|uniref:Uncharacterized protein n=1 Tax=Rhabdobacter roseus TaxID=1655419 RepID=A0A840TF56_9BACT|nr:HmuY family protein [Rhabdobacter roseus]MBB5282134.1 hypothetical protein [Rhabdobacter roseus]
MKQNAFWGSTLLLLLNFVPLGKYLYAQEVPLKPVTITNLPADPADGPAEQAGRFTFFSLRTGQVVPNADSLTDRWDLAFRGTTVLVNGGAGRRGKGGAYLHNGSFNELTQLSTEVPFRVDEPGGEQAIAGGSGNGWYAYNAATHEILPVPNRVLVLRTADGRYAKVQILNYYQQSPGLSDSSAPSRYYTFQYVYQPDGTLHF